MNNNTYHDYQEMPYIDPERDINHWLEHPELYPYGKLEKKQMVRLEENILPGHLIMLWRINFNNFTNESVIPQYFEFRYGVDSNEVITTLLKLNYIILNNAYDSLEELTAPQIKVILKTNNLPATGKKQELVAYIRSNLSNEVLEKAFNLRKYQITEAGVTILNKYPKIIKQHGSK